MLTLIFFLSPSVVLMVAAVFELFAFYSGGKTL